MIHEEDIRRLSDDIAREFRPECIILFGSHAYGTPAGDSDVDLLVILPFDGKSAHKALEILKKVRPAIPVDLLVRTPEQVRDRVAKNDWFMREAVLKGRKLYESANR